MQRVLFTSLDAAIAALILIPVFWFINKKYIHSNLRATLYLLFAVYLSAVFSVAGLPDIRYIRFQPNINTKLFAYMFTDARSSLLNVILFLPMGFFLPVLWRKDFSFGKTLLFGLSVSGCIELLQLFTYRATDVNDLITNTLGTMIGFCIGSMVNHFLKEKLPYGSSKDVFQISGILFLTMFFVHPFIADFIHFLLSL